ncbi:hypothetical protein BDZ97DRAFT_1409125 [Flammula alnicola]|nr:hypothetical protein BDZ97DRAFT_1409125 [Flammula alnicola]
MKALEKKNPQRSRLFPLLFPTLEMDALEHSGSPLAASLRNSFKACATCKKSNVHTFSSFKNCTKCREKNRLKSQLKDERKRAQLALQASLVPSMAVASYEAIGQTSVMKRIVDENRREGKAIVTATGAVKRKAPKALHELDAHEQRAVLIQMKNRLEATIKAASGGGAAPAPVVPHFSKGAKEYQLATALYEAVKRRIQKCSSTQSKMNFSGYHAIVAVSTIDNLKRVEMVVKDLRKIARLPFDYTKSDQSYDFETRARTSTFQCTCLGHAPVQAAAPHPQAAVPTGSMKGTQGDLIRKARAMNAVSGLTVPRLCGGRVVVTAVDDGTHPLRIVGQRIIVRVEHPGSS